MNYLETMQDIIQKSEDTTEAILQRLEAILRSLKRELAENGEPLK